MTWEAAAVILAALGQLVLIVWMFAKLSSKVDEVAKAVAPFQDFRDRVIKLETRDEAERRDAYEKRFPARRDWSNAE